MLPDSYRILIDARRKLQGMHEPVIHFIKILIVNVLGTVTGVAGRHFVMGRLVPAVILITHDVAIYTSLWIILQVRVALTVDEGERTEAKSKAT